MIGVLMVAVFLVIVTACALSIFARRDTINVQKRLVRRMRSCIPASVPLRRRIAHFRRISFTDIVRNFGDAALLRRDRVAGSSELSLISVA